MSVNSTSNYPLDYTWCTVSSYVFIVFDALRVILLLTPSTLILYLGYHQWRQQRSSSHFDIFTYHMVAMELIWFLGTICYYCSKYTNRSVMETVGSVACDFAYYGELCFHVLTCVERYLAVVHPITYLGLRSTNGVKIRNISIGCAWLLNFGLIVVKTLLPSNNKPIPLFCFLSLSIIVITFCSLCVFCVLIHPGPGKRGQENEQSKQRAFQTITAITCTVWLWFVGVLVSNAFQKSPLLSDSVKCLIFICAVWFNLPSCLVLPLLYLHRAGKLSCCCYNNK